MFFVYEKNSKDIMKKIIIYDIQYKRGYPFFTFYKNGQWVTRSAKHYIPCE
jgi:hypothetical protein